MLGMPALTRLRTQPERGGLPHLLLLLTWLQQDEIRFRVLQAEGPVPHLQQLPVLL